MAELYDDLVNTGYYIDFIKQNLSKNGSLVGYLFQCLTCQKHRLHVDFD